MKATLTRICNHPKYFIEVCFFTKLKSHTIDQMKISKLRDLGFMIVTALSFL